MSNDLWGMGVTGIEIHFRCCICGDGVSCRQDFVNVTPVIWRPPNPSGWIRIDDHWYCGDHSDKEFTEIVRKIREMANV